MSENDIKYAMNKVILEHTVGTSLPEDAVVFGIDGVMDEGTFHWHYRTIRHVDSRLATWGLEADNPDDDVYITAHEFSYTGTEYDVCSFAKCAAMNKDEAGWIRDAYDLPPVIEVDDADEVEDEHGFPAYTKYVWLDKTVVRSVK